MSFVLVLSVIALLTAVVGCAAIWGYDVSRAREIAHDTSRFESRQALSSGTQRPEINAG